MFPKLSDTATKILFYTSMVTYDVVGQTLLCNIGKLAGLKVKNSDATINQRRLTAYIFGGG